MGRKAKKAPEGAPAWMTTFADLMSLLLTFFVLLLSFSEMDVKKFKKVVGSVKDAFGVQFEDLLDGMPSTSNPVTNTYGQGAKIWENNHFSQLRLSPDMDAFCEAEKQQKQKDQLALEELHRELAGQLRPLIPEKDSSISLNLEAGLLKIRLQQESLFAKNSVEVEESFEPILDKVQEVLSQSRATLAVTTYYQDLAEQRSQRNRWKLSNVRAMNLGLSASRRNPAFAGKMQYQSLPVDEQRVSTSTEHIDLIVKMSAEK